MGLPDEQCRAIEGDIKTRSRWYYSGAAENSGRIWTSLGTWVKHAFAWIQVTAKAAMGDYLTSVDDVNRWVDLMLASGFQVLGLGDDSIAGHDSGQAESIVIAEGLLENTGRYMGHEYEVNHPVDWDHASYLSAIPWQVGLNKRVLGPNPVRGLAKTFIAKDAAMPVDRMPNYILGIARGFKHYAWVPMLSHICASVENDERVSRFGRDGENPYRVQLRNPTDVDMAYVEQHFLNLFGTLPSEFDWMAKVDWTVPGKRYTSLAFNRMAESCGFDVV